MQRFGLFAAALLSAAACNNEITGLEPPSNPATETFAPALGVDIPSMSQTSSGVYYRDVTVGTGTEIITTTDSVRVTYALYLKAGNLVESSNNVVFTMAGVIDGFRDGLIGMKVGGRRTIVIPSALGYGNETQRDLAGRVTIPRQSTLIFDVQLSNVFNPPA